MRKQSESMYFLIHIVILICVPFFSIFCWLRFLPLLLTAFLFFLSLVLGSGDRQDVRVQEAGKEANQEAQGRVDGADREANFAENKFAIRRESGVRVRNQRCSLPGAHDNERYVHQNMNHRFFPIFPLVPAALCARAAANFERTSVASLSPPPQPRQTEAKCCIKFLNNLCANESDCFRHTRLGLPAGRRVRGECHWRKSFRVNHASDREKASLALFRFVCAEFVYRRRNANFQIIRHRNYNRRHKCRLSAHRQPLAEREG